MRSSGMPEERIITMSFNDVATDPANPFQGKLFNRPDPNGKGVDVNNGCKIDYAGLNVTRENFLSVLTGVGSGKVLKSTAEDNVFVYFVSHGVPGVSQFPSEFGVGELPGPSLHRADLHNALRQMRKAGMFHKLAYYLETCYSGSMFEGLDVPGVYAVTSANATQMGWGTYCPDDGADNVNGTPLKVCLGDGFGVSWMEDIELKGATQVTLEDQYQTISRRYNKSHVLQFGDLSFLHDKSASFIGSGGVNRVMLGAQSGLGPQTKGAALVSALDIDLQYVAAMLKSATTSAEKLQFHRAVVNLCAAASNSSSLTIQALAAKACDEAGAAMTIFT